MKKIILSLTALMATGFAFAQSYPKQPDRTVVNYVEYKKEAKAESAPVEQQTIEATAQVQESQQDEATIQQPATAVNSNTVTENRRNDKARKE